MRLTKILIINFLIYSYSFGQTLPNIPLKNLKGQQVSLKEIIEPNRPTMISFWATWCKPCLQEIKTINENLTKWKSETDVKFIAISVDDSRSQNRVPSFVNARKWNFDVLIDENGDLQRAMNILNVPHTIIMDKNEKIVYQHSSYAMGDEEAYFNILKGLK